MQTFLLVVAGVLAGLAIFSALGVAWLTRKIGNVCESVVQLVQASGLPPFRIHLEPEPAPAWSDAAAIAELTRAFADVGYDPAGDFRVREMEGFALRAFWHPETGFYAVVYDHPDAGLYADAFREFEGGGSVTISTAPATGMDRPPHAPLFRLDEAIRADGAVERLHARLRHEAIGRKGARTRPEAFAAIFQEAWSREMDWRIARGGITRTEIERIAEVTGEPLPSDAQVELIQGVWRGAIAGFVAEEVQRTWLANAALGAAEWERVRDRVVIVHEQGEVEDWIDALAWSVVEGEGASGGVDLEDDEACSDAHQAARDRIAPLFWERPLRDAFADAQALLPEKGRYARLGAVEAPWPADVWAAPEGEGA